jgi:hypothetical protein
MKLSATTRAFVLAAAALLSTAAFSESQAKPTVEVAFVLDTTGSMGGLIEGAKRKIWSIATAIAGVKDDELPDNLRALKPEQRAAELDKQMKERNALNEKLTALVAKRDRYIAEQTAKAPPKTSSFDGAVKEALRAQIKR